MEFLGNDNLRPKIIQNLQTGIKFQPAVIILTTV